jgi:alanyl-tRNA synthetase
VSRLYFHDATLLRFSAQVTALADEGRVVYLDRTAFYPTSGGQPHDLGTLADVVITDVVDEDDRIAHHLTAPLGLPVGAMVVGEIDGARRRDHMQQHTGQHLLSALLHDRYGWPTVSVHFGDQSSTIDIGAPSLSPAELVEIEAAANALASTCLEVSISFEEASLATGLRKASDREGVLRIVTIEGLDRSACGGTHVANTGAIGAIVLRRAERTKGHVRIEFLCGDRVINRARQDAELLQRTALLFSAAPAEVPVLVEQQQLRAQELERERKRLQQELARHEAAALWRDSPPDVQGVRSIRITTAAPVKESEAMVQQLLALGPCRLLVLHEASGGVLLAASPESGLDAGAALRSALQAVGGRGGGSPRLAQGAVSDPAQLPALRISLGF